MSFVNTLMKGEQGLFKEESLTAMQKLILCDQVKSTQLLMIWIAQRHLLTQPLTVSRTLLPRLSSSRLQ